MEFFQFLYLAPCCLQAVLLAEPPATICWQKLEVWAVKNILAGGGPIRLLTPIQSAGVFTCVQQERAT
jgi:hypothetical protein